MDQCNISNGGWVDPSNLELAIRCLINERRGRIAVKAFDRRVKDELDILEPDNQGYIKFQMLEDALVLYIKDRQRSRYTTIFWALFAVTCVVFLGATFGLVYLVVDIHKDISALDGQLVSRNTGAVLQTASSDMYVKNGLLISRSSTQSQSRRQSGGATSSTVQIVAFSAQLGSSPSSSWTPEQLASITSLTITSSSLYGVYMDVHGFTIVPAPGQGIPGDKYVIFQVGGGLQLQLMGTEVTPVTTPQSMEQLLELALPGEIFADVLRLLRSGFQMRILFTLNLLHRLQQAQQHGIYNVGRQHILLPRNLLRGAVQQAPLRQQQPGDADVQRLHGLHVSRRQRQPAGRVRRQRVLIGVARGRTALLAVTVAGCFGFGRVRCFPSHYGA